MNPRHARAIERPASPPRSTITGYPLMIVAVCPRASRDTSVGRGGPADAHAITTTQGTTNTMRHIPI
jgi:hypothetical protein